MKAVLRCVVPVLGLVLVLAGCGDGDADPSSSPSVSVSSSPSVSVSPSPSGPTEPVLPEAAKKNDEAGAIAFVKHYWAMVNYAQATGDTDGLAKLAADECAVCAGGLRGIRNAYEDGGSLVGGDVEVKSATAKVLRTEDGAEELYLVDIEIDIAPQTVMRPGVPDKTHDGGRRSLTMSVFFEDATWMVALWETK